jgi:lipopolysaccharide export system protein LptA
MLFSRKALFLATCSIFWAPLVIADSKDTQQPISIEADQAVLDKNKQTSIYTGHVVLKQGGIEVKANTVTVYTKQGQLQRVIVEGDPVHYRQQQQGHEDIRGVSQRMEYDTGSKQLLMLGNAELWQGGNRFSGDRIQYDTEQEKVIATGESSNTETGAQRVEITLQPKSSQTSSSEQKSQQFLEQQQEKP